ncbi:uncharacterized protein BDZ99DRAFT_540833 [Mytilinidion resinicola]|uniref:Uncharacterized protein n=1 Tax=Mytilinidion resinicola TaxID=574789 RepID=A0A6A6Y8R6_9PEZI|nr:uncharacterized protein BDZ99DRAFT_540833 [Mytilinidion resinicola]KAF2805212.1 hypothetical protein BDZ99DRAFT_540833 [Mytilinidion resinicola]
MGDMTGEHSNNSEALTRYIKCFEYGSQGNILKLHDETPGESRSWTRHYEYDEPSSIIPSEKKNRLSCTKIKSRIKKYHYNGRDGITGSIIAIPSVPTIEYNY